MEVVFSSLAELREERQQNEKVLAEECAKSKQLELKVEAVEARYAVVTEKNVRMLETVKIAEQKVAQTQAHVQIYEELNSNKKKKVKELKHNLKDIEENRAKDLVDFRVKITALTDKFRNARHFYKAKSLICEVMKCDEEKTIAVRSESSNEEQLQAITSQLESLQIQHIDFNPSDAMKIGPETWNTTIKLFLAGGKAATEALEHLKEDLKDLENEEKGLRSELDLDKDVNIEE